MENNMKTIENDIKLIQSLQKKWGTLAVSFLVNFVLHYLSCIDQNCRRKLKVA